jgi:hypothetical protein
MLSQTSKLGCKSWSLEAFSTCPGAIGTDGEVVDPCKVCYARGGFYHMPDAIALRHRNKEDWQSDDWVSRMVKALKRQTRFRWFDSGDMYSVSLAEKILAVMQQTPHVKHWLPTRMYKFAKYQGIIDAMRQLDNVVVRASSDSVKGEILENQSHSSTIVPSAGAGIGYECPAYKQEGKCLDCRACWSKSVPVISYPYHGAKGKIIKILAVKA